MALDAGDRQKVVVAALEHHGVEAALIDQSFDQRGFEGWCLTITVEAAPTAEDAATEAPATDASATEAPAANG